MAVPRNVNWYVGCSTAKKEFKESHRTYGFSQLLSLLKWYWINNSLFFLSLVHLQYHSLFSLIILHGTVKFKVFYFLFLFCVIFWACCWILLICYFHLFFFPFFLYMYKFSLKNLIFFFALRKVKKNKKVKVSFCREKEALNPCWMLLLLFCTLTQTPRGIGKVMIIYHTECKQIWIFYICWYEHTFMLTYI